MKILLADDDSRLQLVVRMWLEKNNHQIETASNGQEALTRFQQEDFDILITDVNMPLMNGVDLIEKVLQLPRPPELIVLLTSRCDISKLQKEINSPKVCLLNKPFSPAALAKLIENNSAQPAP